MTVIKEINAGLFENSLITAIRVYRKIRRLHKCKNKSHNHYKYGFIFLKKLWTNVLDFHQIDLTHYIYIFSLMSFNVNNQQHYQTNSAIHSVNARIGTICTDKSPTSLCFHKNAYYSGIKIFNSLLSSLRSLMNTKAQFKVALKMYLSTHSFNSVEEFLMFTNKSCLCVLYFVIYSVSCCHSKLWIHEMYCNLMNGLLHCVVLYVVIKDYEEPAASFLRVDVGTAGLLVGYTGMVETGPCLS
jgi:hypothetical protein